MPTQTRTPVVASTLSAAVVQVTVMSVELIPLFQSYGLPLATAVGLAAIFGPSQVGGRVVEMALGRRFRPEDAVSPFGDIEIHLKHTFL